MIDSNLYVWIESGDGTVYKEYDYGEDIPGRKDCWIESKQGENFRICWRFTGSTPNCLQSSIWLDGVSVSGGLLRPEEFCMAFRMSGPSIGAGHRLPFRFGKQQLTDDERVAPRDDPQLSELSTIRIVFEFAKFIGYTDTAPEPPKMRGAVHEKAAKKAHGDSAGFGEPKKAGTRRWCRTEKLPHLGKFEFVFHYAPRDWLLAHDIIPKPLVEPRSPTKVEATRKNSPNKVKQEKIFKDQPATPILRLKRVHTSKDVASDSDDSDVVVVNDPMNASNDKARTKNKRIRIESPVNLSPGAPPHENDDVIDLASSEPE